ncbi:hypothetical protein [Burkholderia stabilis]|uniref:hypothetical protein n=1 Tax=Burkholderia stabilis TaxID=95485 RepID=UPI0013CE934B|nr:hypothetical protein [Burkholderia stabilis]HDR9585672.1 hypothetical protein [Burkholderia stabilis]HDR9652868.1 hypothetical protein [Burkholderia stabilis]HDR9654700.1 hypothetical protein [Burkholderia stabilis]HDR9679969.1 hypothetical protein [Burkholderia stabilis]
MAAPLSGGVRRKNRQLSRWRFFYARSAAACAGVFDEIDKNLLISWTSARSSDRPYNSG